MLTKPRLDPSSSSAKIHADVSRLVRDALSIYEVDEHLLAVVLPDVVITQDQCDVCAVDLPTVQRALSRAVGDNVDIVSLRLDSLDDVLSDWQVVADAIGKPAAGAKLVSTFRQRMAELRIRARRRPRTKVLCLEWIDPPMVAGNWVPELVEAVGGQPLLARAGHKSPMTTWQAIHEADPDAIIVMACGFDIPRTRRELHALQGTKGWMGLRAVQEGSVFVTDGNAYFNRPGPRTLATLDALAEMIGGARAKSLHGEVWQGLDEVEPPIVQVACEDCGRRFQHWLGQPTGSGEDGKSRILCWDCWRRAMELA